MKIFELCLAAAMALAIPAAASAQDATQGPDEPMQMLFQVPGVVAFMTAPKPLENGHKQVWTWLFLKQAIPSGANNLALEWDIDCAAGTVRTVRTATYQDTTYVRTDPGPAAGTAPAAGTPGAVTMASACATERSRTRPSPNLTAVRATAAQTLAAQH
ncbi:MAG: hypothetical protein EON89_07265 [Brevundimonas sp.]|nr:MAG: hypothetical protein EON89_07265 [Brevundimonas sp.]